LKNYIKKVYLSIIDKYWVEHIDDMTYLREKVSLFGYAQIDPLVIYKKESYEKFQKLMANIKD
jgi:preprotein translocase subunit SecA